MPSVNATPLIAIYDRPQACSDPPVPRSLLVPQRDHGIDLRRTSRGQAASEQRHGDQG